MRRLPWLTAALWLGASCWLYTVPRTDFTLLWSVYSMTFVLYLLLMGARRPVTLREGLFLGLAVRMAGFFFTPLWSDDYYRFIWDGMLTMQGIPPMAYTPVEILAQPGVFPVDTTLFPLLNSQIHYSVYPPVAQGLFALSYWINGSWLTGHILFQKFIWLLADAGIVWLLVKLLRSRQAPPVQALWYALNPLVIMEFGGNLHPDGLMILGLLAAIWLALQDRPWWSGLAMAGSILSKLVTGMLAPFLPVVMEGPRLFTRMAWILLWVFGGLLLAFGTSLHWLQSVRLWFQTFEFNASIYYVVRWLTAQVKGYNAIADIGPALAMITLAVLMVIWGAYRIKGLFSWATAMVLALTVYFLMGTTLHPWYLTTLVALSVVSGHIYPIAWSYLVVLSYSHYAGGVFREQYDLLTLEYVLLFGVMGWEYHRTRINKKPLPV